MRTETPMRVTPVCTRCANAELMAQYDGTNTLCVKCAERTAYELYLLEGGVIDYIDLSAEAKAQHYANDLAYIRMCDAEAERAEAAQFDMWREADEVAGYHDYHS